MVTDPAFWTAITGVIGSITALIGLFRHTTGPAHNQPPVVLPPSKPAMKAPPPPVKTS